MARKVLLMLVVTLAAGLSAGSGVAQIPPENHYLVYNVDLTYTFTGDIHLIDQFYDTSVSLVVMDKFANPVDKNGEGFWNFDLHHTWWHFDEPHEPVQVEIENQFGLQNLTVTDARYLVLPATKNMPGTPIPIANHYKAYLAEGPPVNIPVQLTDQFQTRTAVVTNPVFFLNPVTKIVNGVVYEQTDPLAHLTCYNIDPQLPVIFTILTEDQFGLYQNVLLQDCWLCVPTEKRQVIATESSTWGGVKSLYRD